MTDILKTCFLWMLYSSISASIIALLVLAVKLIFKDRIKSRVYCILWFLVIVKLITAPFAPGSQISVFNLFGHNTEQVSHALPIAFSDLMARDRFEAASKSLHIVVDDEINQTTVAENGELKLTDRSDSISGAGYGDVVFIAALIWLIVLLIMVSVIMYSGIAFRKKIKNAERIPASQLPEFILSKSKRDIRADIEVYSSEHIAAPCIAGILKSRIYMPRRVAPGSDKRQLKHMLMHEYAHFRRWDNLTNVVIATINIVHWFNPVLWYAMHQLKQDREVSCDAYALEVFGQDEAIPYGMTLINFCRCLPKRHPQFSLLNYYETKKQIERRIFMIKGFKKGTYKVTVATIILCMVLGAAIFTNAAASPSNTNSGTSAQDANSVNANRSFRIGGPSYIVSNLEKASEYTGFNFKVPGYIPSGFKPNDIAVDEKATGSSNLVDISYYKTDDRQYFQIIASKANLLVSMKTLLDKSFKYTFQEKSTEISGVKGTTLTEIREIKDKEKSTKSTKKSYIWNDSGICYMEIFYNFEQYQDGNSSLYCNISKKDLEQIVSSMKLPKDIKNVNYTLPNSDQFMIYDEKDLAAAEKVLGFAPVFPLRLSCGYIPSDSQVLISTASDGKDTYCIQTHFSSVNTTETNGKIKATFFQGKTTYVYDELCSNNSITRTNPSTKKKEAFAVKSFNLGDTSVYYYKDSQADTHYVWKQNDICYIVVTEDDITKKENVISALVAETLK